MVIDANITYVHIWYTHCNQEGEEEEAGNETDFVNESRKRGRSQGVAIHEENARGRTSVKGKLGGVQCLRETCKGDGMVRVVGWRLELLRRQERISTVYFRFCVPCRLANRPTTNETNHRQWQHCKLSYKHIQYTHHTAWYYGYYSTRFCCCGSIVNNDDAAVNAHIQGQLGFLSTTKKKRKETSCGGGGGGRGHIFFLDW